MPESNQRRQSATLDETEGQLELLLISGSRKTTAHVQSALCGSAEFSLRAITGEVDALRMSLEEFRPAICVVDVDLPDVWRLVEELRLICPEGKILFLARDCTRSLASDLLLSAGNGCVEIPGEASTLPKKMRAIASGGAPISEQIAACLLAKIQQKSCGGTSPDCSLSPRELEVMRLLNEGALYKEIAATLGISLQTVRRHVMNAYRKLGVRSRDAAKRKLRSAQ